MDHLLPAELKERGIRISSPVPWLGFPDHDNYEGDAVRFLDYPKSRGWDIGDPRDTFERGSKLTFSDSTGKPATREAVFGFLQSWMYFGFLESITRFRIKVHPFIEKNEDGQEVFRTDGLVRVFETWREYVTQVAPLSRSDYDLWQRLTRQSMVLMASVFYQLTLGHQEIYQTVPAYFHPVLRSISILYETVKGMLHVIFPHNDIELPTNLGSLYPEDISDFCPSFGRELVSKGYCPFQIKNVEDLSGFPLLEYMNTHSLLSNPPDDHTGCQKTACKLYQLDSQETKHGACACGKECQKVLPPIEDITAALDNGFIPIVSYSGEAGGTTPRLNVARRGEKTRYVAFSHVWADGLGSCSEDGLYACQLERLNRLAIQSLSLVSIEPTSAAPHPDDEAVHFWIDSLCVPEARDHRKIAIKLMSQTYTDASIVCVIDRTIRAARDPSDLELLTRIWLSGWQYRLWTLQEGLLAERTAFEVSDKVVPLPKVKSKQLGDNRVRDQLELFLVDYLVNGLELNENGRRKLSVGFVANQLVKRRTKRPADETLAISTLLRINPMSVYDLNAEDRMVKFLQLATYLPPSLPFRTGPKCKKPGFRWAPSTFMVDIPVLEQRLDLQDQSAICTSNGLFANYDFFVPFTSKHTLIATGWKGRLGEEYILAGSGADGKEFKYRVVPTKDPDLAELEYNAFIMKNDDHCATCAAVWWDHTGWEGDLEVENAIQIYTRARGKVAEITGSTASTLTDLNINKLQRMFGLRSRVDVRNLALEIPAMLGFGPRLTTNREFYNCKFIAVVTLQRAVGPEDQINHELDDESGSITKAVETLRMERNIHLV